MARSIGEAAATGLQAGLGLAFQLNDRRDAKVRQERADAERMEDRTRALQRQSLADADAADASQLATLQRTQQANMDAGIQPSETEVATLQGNMRTLQGRAADRATQRGGASLATETPDLTKADVDLSKYTGKQINAYLKDKTGFDGRGFVRDANGVSPVGAAFDTFRKGMDSGDMTQALPGVNALLAHQLGRIKGKPSPHGGTIVGAEVADLHPDPRSSPDDPRVVPMLKVYVNDPNATGPKMENGATGWYLAPLTEGRETGKDAKVKSLSVRESMAHFGRYAELEELINGTPEFRAKVEEGGLTPADSRATLAQLGVKAPKKTTESFNLRKDEVRHEFDVDPSGKRIPGSERKFEGNPSKTSTGRPGALQQDIDAIKALVDDEEITEDDGKARIKALLDKRTTGTKAQGLAKGGTGGGKGGAAGPSLKEREQDRKEKEGKLKSADREVDNEEKAVTSAQHALDSFHKRFPNGQPRARKGDTTEADEYKTGLAAAQKRVTDAEATANKTRETASKLRAELDKPPESAAKPAATGKAVATLPTGAKQIGTSGGKPVYQTPDGKKFVAQ